MNTVAMQGARLSPSTASLATVLLRDICGNPWKPLPGDRPQGSWYICEKCNHAADIERKRHRCPTCGSEFIRKYRERDEWLRWNDGAIPKIAQSIYDGRRWDELPVLADALEDSGCQDEQILQHCRSECEPGMGRCDYHPHVRGCWVLDLLLGQC